MVLRKLKRNGTKDSKKESLQHQQLKSEANIKSLGEIFSLSVSVQFSCSVVSDSLRPHGLQHTRPPYPSPIPGTYSNSCPLKMKLKCT